MAVEENCRHFLRRSSAGGDAVERCRIGVVVEVPMACPEGCVFFEARRVADPGWSQAPTEPMSNTATALANVPVPKRRRGTRKRR